MSDILDTATLPVPDHVPRAVRPPSARKPNSDSRNIPSSSSLHKESKLGSFRKRKRTSAGYLPSKVAKTSATSQPSSLARPIVRSFPVWTSNLGVLTVCRVTFDCLRGRDNRMAGLVSELQLLYVTVLSFWFRVKDVGLRLGYQLDTQHHADLKRTVNGIYLPSLCRRYIDSIGEYALPSGAKIAPLTCTLESAPDHADILTPHDILILAGKPVPDNYWAIDYDWIQDWNQLTTRASREALGFSLITDTLEGKAEFACTYRVCANRADFIEPLAPFALTRTELELGASFRYRSIEAKDTWLGRYNYLLEATHTSEEIQYAQLLSERMVSSIVT